MSLRALASAGAAKRPFGLRVIDPDAAEVRGAEAACQSAVLVGEARFPRLEVADFAHARLDDLLQATEARLERRKDRAGETQDVTTWFKVTLWGRQAETASQYLTKGRPVYIEGRLRVEEWTDRDGRQRHTLEVQATDMQFIGGRGEESPASRTEASATSGSTETNAADISDDDIPF